MGDALTWTMRAIGGTAVLLNLSALYMFFKKPAQRMGSNFMIPVVAALNILQSITRVLSMSVIVIHNFCLVSIVSGPTKSSYVGLVTSVINFLALHSCLLIVVNSFLKKYIILCRSKYNFLYSSPKWTVMFIVLNILVIMSWSSVIVVSLCSRRKVEKEIEAEAALISGINLGTAAFLGICTKPKEHWLAFALHIEVIFTRTSLLLLGFYWAHRVKKTLNESCFSQRAKILQRRLNNMLLGQTLCLAVLLQPRMVILPILLYSGVTVSPSITSFSKIMLLLFPVFSPIITIVSLCRNGSSHLKTFKQKAVFDITKL